MERALATGCMYRTLDTRRYLPPSPSPSPFSQTSKLRFDEPEDGAGGSCFVSFAREEREVDAAAQGWGGGEGLGTRRGVREEERGWGGGELKGGVEGEARGAFLKNLFAFTDL